MATPPTPTAGALTINATTGVILSPVTAALFKSANGIGSGSGTVTSVSVVTANGFGGTVATGTTTPAITLKTTITGLLKGNGTAISAAVSGTDYAPATTGSFVLTGNGSGGFTNTDLSYSTPTLTVPASFGITGAGSLAFTAGGSNQNITLTPSGTGVVVVDTIRSTASQNLSLGTTSFGAGINIVSATGVSVFGPTPVFQSGATVNAASSNANTASTGSLSLRFGIMASSPSNSTDAWVGVHNTGGPGITAGDLVLIPRTSVAGSIRFLTGTTSPSLAGFFNANGTLTLNAADRSLSAWGVGGPSLTVPAATYTDSSSSGTVTTAVANSFAVPTFAASSATTFTNAANLYIAGDVSAGTNVTLTNSYGLWNVGKTRLDGAVQLPSTNTAGIQLYNTADQTTNYERLELVWSSNAARIRTVQGGSGTSRTLTLQNPAGLTINLNNSGSVGLDISGFSSSQASWTMARIASFTSTATSGTNAAFSLTPTYNQASGTAANTDLLINRTETAVGSGPQYWEDRQVGGVSRMATGSAKVLTTDGTVTTVQTYTIPASTTWAFDGYVVARRTGGASGTAEDGASYRVEGVFKNAAGTATSIGSTVTVIGESQAGWDVTVDATGATARIRVTGASGNNISWVWTGNVRQVSS